MAASYKSIDYRVRPAKSIERKLLVDSFRALNAFGSLEHYRYIGLGSVYFSDFILVHRALGIEDMVSIENATDKIVQARFKLNVPYGNIQMRFGTSTAVLQKLEWSQRTICWLDYDGALTGACLDDAEYFARNAASGSVLLMSFNAGALSGGDEEGFKPLDLLKKAVGEAVVPVEIKNSDLVGWQVGEIYRRIVFESIKTSLNARASTGSAGSKLTFKPIYYFRYADGVRMITIGGVFVDDSQLGIFRSCNFEQFEFYKDSTDAYTIEPPILTYAEMRQLDVERTKYTCSLPLPAGDIEKYQRFYRHFPKFVEAEIS